MLGYFVKFLALIVAVICIILVGFSQNTSTPIVGGNSREETYTIITAKAFNLKKLISLAKKFTKTDVPSEFSGYTWVIYKGKMGNFRGFAKIHLQPNTCTIYELYGESKNVRVKLLTHLINYRGTVILLQKVKEASAFGFVKDNGQYKYCNSSDNPISFIMYKSGNGKKIKVSDDNIGTEKPTMQTKMYIASITKVFVCLALVKLHFQKKLNIFDPANKYSTVKLPDSIRIFDIMNHTSGMKYDYFYDIELDGVKSVSEIFDQLQHDIIIKSIPGEFNYSNIGYILLGYILEQAYGGSWIDALNEFIFSPLGMEDTTNEISDIPLYNIFGREISNKNYVYYVSTSYGLVSTVKDLAKFSWNFHTILTDEELALFTSLYFNTRNKKIQTIDHSGKIEGSISNLSIRLRQQKPVEVHIFLSKVWPDISFL